MKQPKPMVGQIWMDIGCGNSVVISGLDEEKVHFDGDCWVLVDLFFTSYKFQPQNDLEFAAVNLDKWYFAADHIHFNGGTLLVCHESFADAISCERWQNERYRLGLDTKPHYKLINGQWSETI